MVSMFAGVCGLAIVFFAFCGWYGLRSYKEYGPKSVIIMYAINAGFAAIYAIAMSTIIKNADNTIIFGYFVDSSGRTNFGYIDLSSLKDQTTMILSAIYGAVFTALNVIYFKKRAHLFKK